MKIVVISGSSRKGANSTRVAQWMVSELKSQHISTELLDLAQIELPINHEDIWADIANHPAAKEVKAMLSSADGFVIVSPEWNGMAAPALKNLFVYAEKTMADKAALLVAVSATRYGGSFPIAELRETSFKNTRVAYIPEYIIVREADDMFVDESPRNENDEYVRKRSQYALRVLVEYTNALNTVRESGVTDYKMYANGM